MTPSGFFYYMSGDVTIKLFHHKRLSTKKIARTAFNSAFFDENQDELVFKLCEIDPDNLIKKGYPADFQIHIKIARLCNCSNKEYPMKICEVCSKYNTKEVSDWNIIHDILNNHKTSPEQATFQLFGNEEDDVVATLKADTELIDDHVEEEEIKKYHEKKKRQEKER